MILARTRSRSRPAVTVDGTVSEPARRGDRRTRARSERPDRAAPEAPGPDRPSPERTGTDTTRTDSTCTTRTDGTRTTRTRPKSTRTDTARLAAAAVALVTGAVLLMEWVRRTSQYLESLEANKTSWHIRPLDDFVGAVGLGLLAWSTAVFVLAVVRARRRRRSAPGIPEATPTPESRPEAPETR